MTITEKDDSLLILTYLPKILVRNKIVQKISFFYYGFWILTVIGDILVMLANKQWLFFLGQYSAFTSGMGVIITSYITMYNRAYVNMFWNMYHDIFPFLWPLRSLGNKDFNKFQKLAKFTKIILKTITVLALLTSTGGLPWYGDDYNIILPVKVATDYFEGMLLKTYLIIFYSSLYHMSLTMVANVCCLTYVVLHLYNQIRMLNVRLRNLVNGPDIDHALENVAYQDFVSAELIACISLHQILFKYTQRINNLIYGPIFYFTVSGVLIGLSVLLLPKTSTLDLIRTGFVAVFAVCVTLAFCILGQLLENESEQTFNLVYNTSWYSWSIKNRKFVQFFLHNAQKHIILSSSGLITINYQLLIRLYRSIYTTLTFLMHVSSIRSP